MLLGLSNDICLSCLQLANKRRALNVKRAIQLQQGHDELTQVAYRSKDNTTFSAVTAQLSDIKERIEETKCHLLKNIESYESDLSTLAQKLCS